MSSDLDDVVILSSRSKLTCLDLDHQVIKAEHVFVANAWRHVIYTKERDAVKDRLIA